MVCVDGLNPTDVVGCQRSMSSAQLSAVFFLQLFFILAVCRLIGIFARRLGQPQVVGEMIAGVIMGPSLLGLLFPSWQQAIFPKESLKILYVLAQLGVGLYMFLVGTEFKTELFRSRGRSAASVSIAGMVAPFVVGGILAIWLWKVPGLFSAKATQFEAILFLGAAMSITAFPMLARIIYEQGITGTPLGKPALFSIMVMMAIITTLMTSPLFALVSRTKGKTAMEEDTAAVEA